MWWLYLGALSIAEESNGKLCEVVLSEVEREIISHNYPLGSLKTKEAIIDGGEHQLEGAVLLESLLPSEDGATITREIQYFNIGTHDN